MLLLLLLLVYGRVQSCTKPAAVQQVLLLLCKAAGPLLLLWKPRQATVQPL
jgi:hypothetical protein